MTLHQCQATPAQLRHAAVLTHLVLAMVLVAGCVSKDMPGFALPAQQKVFAREFYDRLSDQYLRGRPVLLIIDGSTPSLYRQSIQEYLDMVNANRQPGATPATLHVKVEEIRTSRAWFNEDFRVVVSLIVPELRSAIILSRTRDIACTGRNTPRPSFECTEFFLGATAKVLLLEM